MITVVAGVLAVAYLIDSLLYLIDVLCILSNHHPEEPDQYIAHQFTIWFFVFNAAMLAACYFVLLPIGPSWLVFCVAVKCAFSIFISAFRFYTYSVKPLTIWAKLFLISFEFWLGLNLVKFYLI